MIGIYAGIGPLFNLGTIPFSANPYAWNDKANLLFVSNPAGVGYSYAGREEDLYNNDDSISIDLFKVL